MTRPALVVMAGLPGTGKSALAAEIARRTAGLALDKDRIRVAILPIGESVYREEENDFVVRVMTEAAALLLRRRPERPVILDGRTFARRSQVEALCHEAGRLGLEPWFIECVCAPEVAKQRLLADRDHPARDRGPALYDELAGRAEPLEAPKLVVDTGRLTVQQAADRVMANWR